MSYIFLLGAGASVEAGLPTANHLTEKVLEHFKGGYGGVYQVLRYTLAGLMFEDSKKQNRKGQEATIDIERLLNIINILAQRENLDLDPFISSWDAALESLDYPNRSTLGNHEVRHFVEKLSRHVKEGQRSVGTSFLDNDFARAVKSLTGKSKSKSLFSVTVTESTASLRELLRVQEGGRLEYLKPIKAFAKDNTAMPIATLNYDNVMEDFCSNSELSCSTGIENWSKRFEVTQPERGIFLMKLHGSLNWRYQKRDSEQSAVEEFSIVPWNNPDKGRPAIIFGQRDKLTTDGPFLDLLRAFRDQLFKSSHLVVVGYSFRDTHINNYIKYWFARTTNRKVTVIDPNATESMLPSELFNEYVMVEMSKPTSKKDNERVAGIKTIKMGAGEGLAAFAREEGLM